VSTRNLADPDDEPTDAALRELLANAAQDARARHARAQTVIDERVRAERERLGIAASSARKGG